MGKGRGGESERGREREREREGGREGTQMRKRKHCSWKVTGIRHSVKHIGNSEPWEADAESLFQICTRFNHREIKNSCQ